MFSLLIFIIVLSIIILIHELGHFTAAKKQGVRIEKFSLGFGPKIFSIKKNDTEYLISLFPLGGYVKLAGDNRSEIKGEPFEYFSKSCGSRAKIIFAGPFLNYCLAFLCFWLVFTIGFPSLTTKIGDVIKDYPASNAGIKKGDQIIEVGSKKVENWEQMQKAIQPSTGEIDIKVKRNDKIINFLITPEIKETKDLLGSKKNISMIGIMPEDEWIILKYNPVKSFFVAGSTLIDFTVLTYKSIWRMVIGRLSFKESVTGPLGIFYITKKAASFGISALLHLMAVLNLSLAIFNLLPLPIFDGGHIVLLGLEKIRRRPLSEKAENILNNIGLAMIIILAVFVFYNDLAKFGVFKNIKLFK
ncbi:MAG: RIP metalloprotease RseP [Candidatus Omnitrophota bacterium]